MINHKTYIPILKWKQGEYQALNALNEQIKKQIVPLFEITPIGFDHEKQVASKSLDKHITNIGTRLKKKWGQGLCFIDISNLNLLGEPNGLSYVDKIFNLYRNEGCTVVPVVEIDYPETLIEEIKSVIQIDKNGLCLRLKSKYLTNSLNEQINKFLKLVCLSKSEIDLIVDFEDLPNVGQSEQFLDFAIDSLKKLEEINLWRSFAVAGSSFPKTADKTGAKRLEWLFYKKCYNEFINSYRLPAFSDYGINTPEHLDFDMRVVKPYAKMKYTQDYNWYISKGTAVRGPKSRGFGQFKDLCRELIGKDFYRGEQFSAGDEYIKKCAEGEVSTGNLSTWVCVSTNQHLVKVVNDLSNLYGFSI